MLRLLFALFYFFPVKLRVKMRNFFMGIDALPVAFRLACFSANIGDLLNEKERSDDR